MNNKNALLPNVYYNPITYIHFTSRTFVRLQAILIVQKLPERLHLFLPTYTVFSNKYKFHTSLLVSRIHRWNRAKGESATRTLQFDITTPLTSLPLVQVQPHVWTERLVTSNIESGYNHYRLVNNYFTIIIPTELAPNSKFRFAIHVLYE